MTGYEKETHGLSNCKVAANPGLNLLPTKLLDMGQVPSHLLKIAEVVAGIGRTTYSPKATEQLARMMI
jgi:hypothetical protein